ncbi:MAG: tRNA dihydrouridine synthase DusB [Candidatus Zixiibacteriota bacterium]
MTVTGRVVLAPMAGITDSVFRRLCRRFGAAIVYSEFLSTDGLVFKTMNQQHKLVVGEDEHPVAFQLFGARTETFAPSARLLAELSPDIIDLNFGCPANKVVGRNGGAAILKDLDLLGRIVSETVQAVPLPVTVKMRAGWDRETLVFEEAAERAVAAGAQAITLHARTRVDGPWGPHYQGTADWSYITRLKAAVTDVPVIGNGDVTSPERAEAMLRQTGCDAVMVGRAALGRPWIFAEINHYLATGRLLPEPSIADRLTLAWMHLRDKVAGSAIPDVIVRSQRKTMAAYLRGWPDTHELKAIFMNLESLADIRSLFVRYLADHPDLPRCEGDDWLDRHVALDRDALRGAAAAVVAA